MATRVRRRTSNPCFRSRGQFLRDSAGSRPRRHRGLRRLRPRPLPKSVAGPNPRLRMQRPRGRSPDPREWCRVFGPCLHLKVRGRRFPARAHRPRPGTPAASSRLPSAPNRPASARPAYCRNPSPSCRARVLRRRNPHRWDRTGRALSRPRAVSRSRRMRFPGPCWSLCRRDRRRDVWRPSPRSLRRRRWLHAPRRARPRSPLAQRGPRRPRFPRF